MGRQYNHPLVEAAVILQVDPSTVRRWLKACPENSFRDPTVSRGAIVRVDRLVGWLQAERPEEYGNFDLADRLIEYDRLRDQVGRGAMDTEHTAYAEQASTVTATLTTEPSFDEPVRSESSPSNGGADAGYTAQTEQVLAGLTMITARLENRDSETALVLSREQGQWRRQLEQMAAEAEKRLTEVRQEYEARLAHTVRPRRIATALAVAAVIVAGGVGGLTIYLQRSLTATRQQAAAQVAQATATVNDHAGTIDTLTDQLQTTAARLEQTAQAAQAAQGKATQLAEGQAALEREKAATAGLLTQAQSEAEQWKQVADDRQEELTEALARVAEMEATATTGPVESGPLTSPAGSLQ